jgi:uncharacterized SAM-binding protein YcdF (DUF218 family)
MTRRRAAGIAALVLAGGLAAATARWILWPDTDEPGRADAVVVLGGGAGERLPAALELVKQGVAPVLLVSHGEREAPELCGREEPFEVICFEPKPDRTRGEAAYAARLARERGWRSILVVTSRYHAVRARMLFRRCFDGEVRAVGVRPPSAGGLPTPKSLVREWASYGHAFLVQRHC